jgi:hypothetical protein
MTRGLQRTSMDGNLLAVTAIHTRTTRVLALLSKVGAER